MGFSPQPVAVPTPLPTSAPYQASTTPRPCPWHIPRAEAVVPGGCQRVPATRCQPGRLCWQCQAFLVPDICAAAGAEPGRWRGASGEWPGAAQPPALLIAAPPLQGSGAGRWMPPLGGTCTEPGWFGVAAECAHTPGLIDRALLAPVAERLSGAGSSSQLCRLLPLLFLGIQGISTAHRG